MQSVGLQVVIAPDSFKGSVDAATAAEAIGSTARLLIPAGIVVVVCLLGIWAFIREAPRVAENL